MANPQPDEFTRISNELYMAIMQTDFTKRQRKIVDLVIRMSYGCGKKSALLRLVDFELVGVYKTHVRKELDYLVQAKVLFIDGERITLNKNYDQWRISLVRGAADTKRFEAVLHRNLVDMAVTKTVTEVTETVTESEDDGYQNSNQSYQNSNQSVTKTVTKVTKTVTPPENCSYQNSNHQVTKTVTACAPEALSLNGSETPKESIKESYKRGGYKKILFTQESNKNQESVEDVIAKFTRYTSEQVGVIKDYWETIRFTRKTGKVAASIVARQMEYWERFPVNIVLEALEIHMRKYETKQEDYTAGIMRRLIKEREKKGVKLNGQGCQSSRASPNTDKWAGINFDKFLWKGS